VQVLEFLVDDSGSMGTLDAKLTSGQKCDRHQSRRTAFMQSIASKQKTVSAWKF
jgi:hypothetical protein